MALSIFELFKIGIGPSSSHTVGPMWAANRFLLDLESRRLFGDVAVVQSHLYGSLALTGTGHGTDKSVMLGLSGEVPDQIEPDGIDSIIQEIEKAHQINLFGRKNISFDPKRDVVFHVGESLEFHPNGLRFIAFDNEDSLILDEIYYSVGGGFVLSESEAKHGSATARANTQVRYPYDTAVQLLEIGEQHGFSIAEVALENETAWHSAEETRDKLLGIWRVMESCIERGCRQSGVLPGRFGIERRAKRIRDELIARPEASLSDHFAVLDWVNLYALAVNEENAAGGRVVTAPTNGAAGVIPAVLAYYMRYVPGASDHGLVTFLATAAAIGALYKQNASISAAEVGCQGEIGVACSMAAAGLCAVLGGSNAQVENAAEIGMEHNLGLTCDPVGGFVQVPCIERNTMGAVKAINAARIALKGDGSHFVSLDAVIETMRQTGRDMNEKYKETSLGGLAVNIVEC